MLDNWRHIYILTIPLRIILTFQASYLHPDEHFQGFEVLSKLFLGYKTNIPWEFGSLPSRSILPLLLQYPVVYLNQWLNLPPITVYYLTRLQFCLFSWIITDWCLYKIMPTKQERLKLIFFNSISYITLCYQSHTFSNSIETCLVLLLLVIIEDIRDTLELKNKITPSVRDDLIKKHFSQSLLLGIILGIGILNRITFVLWLLLPSYFIIKFGLTMSFKFLCSTIMTTLTTLIFGFGVDIWWFNKSLITKMLIPYLNQFAITKDMKFLKLVLNKFYTSSIASPSIIPLVNNLIYNFKSENLALHGLHARYTHLLINVPLMFGPLVLLIIYPKNYFKTTPFLSFISGLILLSIFPHQELRFLLPLVPLGSCFIDLWLWTKIEKIEPEPKTTEEEPKVEVKEEDKKNDGDDDDEEEEEKRIPQENPNFIRTDSKLIPLIIKFTFVFNLVMCLVMGVLHQGGVVPALEFLQKRNESTKSISIWWRSYSPPIWLLGDTSLSSFQQQDPDLRLIEFLNFVSEDIPQTVSSVVDILGMDPDILKFSLNGVLQNSQIPENTDVLLAAPLASFANILSGDSRFNFTQVFQYSAHLDFDHFDEFSQFGLSALNPGFGIWKIESLAPLQEEPWLD